MDLSSSNSSTADGIQAWAPVGDDQAQLQAGIVETDLPSSSGLKNEAATISNTGIHGMDREIFAAAAKGNTKALSKHGVLLHEKITPTKNTVLRIYVAHASYPTLTNPEELDNHSSIYGDSCLVADMLIEKLQSAEYLWDVTINTKRPTTLTAAQVQRSKEIVTQLLEMCHPQLLLQANDNRDIALHIAARYGLDGVVEVLISTIKARHRDLEKQGEDAWPMLRTTNNDGDTALHEAARFNHLGVVNIFCKEYPDYTYPPNSEGKSPIYLAAERGYRDIVSKILESCTHPGYQGPGGKTALHAAVISGCRDMTHQLLDKEKTLAQVKDEQGWTPLHYAALIGDIWIVSQILHYGSRSTAYIVDKDDEKTALHVAASEGHVGVLIELINRCPDCCELVDRRKRNILHYAIEKRKFKIMKVVQNHPWMSNVLLNGKDVEGNTPLHQLVNIRQQTITESLIQDGKAPTKFIRDARVDKMAMNEQKLNVIDILFDNGHSLSEVEKGDRLDALKRSGARSSRPIKDGARIIDNKEVGKDTVKEAIGVLMVAATLIATVTFAASFTVPGGYRNEKGPEQGVAISTRNVAYRTFVVTNTIAMMMSSSTVLAYLVVCLRLAFRKISGLPYLENQASSIFIAMLAMVIAFIAGTYVVLGGSPVLGVAVCVVGFGVFVGNSIWNCIGT